MSKQDVPLPNEPQAGVGGRDSRRGRHKMTLPPYQGSEGCLSARELLLKPWPPLRLTLKNPYKGVFRHRSSLSDMMGENDSSHSKGR